jgi:hypothetical protein
MQQSDFESIVRNAQTGLWFRVFVELWDGSRELRPTFQSDVEPDWFVTIMEEVMAEQEINPVAPEFIPNANGILVPFKRRVIIHDWTHICHRSHTIEVAEDMEGNKIVARPPEAGPREMVL